MKSGVIKTASLPLKNLSVHFHINSVIHLLNPVFVRLDSKALVKRDYPCTRLTIWLRGRGLLAKLHSSWDIPLVSSQVETLVIVNKTSKDSEDSTSYHFHK